MTPAQRNQHLTRLPPRIASASARPDIRLGDLLGEIEAKEARLDDRSAMSGGESTWDEEELVDMVMDDSEVVGPGDERLLSEVATHRDALRDDEVREAVEQAIRERRYRDAANVLGSCLPPGKTGSTAKRL